MFSSTSEARVGVVPVRSAALAFLCLMAAAASAQVCNVKVVTDASPDYTDMDSLVRSIHANWPTDAEKNWAQFYWFHKARAQTSPMFFHGSPCTDPIRQFNDYGFTMCSTISGIKCSVWSYMGSRCRYWDICNHTVCEVFYDGKYHLYDNSLSALATLCDGKTIAGVEDMYKTLGCPASGGKEERAHIAKYHCINATSPNGFVTGCDCDRRLADWGDDFNTAGLKLRPYLDATRGHRYILNVRPDEVYTRYYHHGDWNSSNKVAQFDPGAHYFADPAYFVPNTMFTSLKNCDPTTADPERHDGFHIRGNGLWVYTPSLKAEDLSKSLEDGHGYTATAAGVQPAKAGEPATAIFKINGANVIASMTIKGSVRRRTEADAVTLAISTDDGASWQDVWTADQTGDLTFERHLMTEKLGADRKPQPNVCGNYEVLVRATLKGAATAGDAVLRAIRFETITQINRRTQPKLNIGRNTVYVGAGEQTESIVFCPEIQSNAFRTANLVEAHNVLTIRDLATIFADKANEDAYVVYRLDTPRDITRLVYGGRNSLRSPAAVVTLLHSVDNGKTWQTDIVAGRTNTPPDGHQFATVTQVPAGCRSVLFKYLMNAPTPQGSGVGIEFIRMEVDYKPVDPGFKPLEVTFTWYEPQASAPGQSAELPMWGRYNFGMVKRSHTQAIDKLPCTYTIDVGGTDHPIMDSLRICQQGAIADNKPGYSDGKDAGGAKWVGNWVTYGKNLALGKKYTLSEPGDGSFNSSDTNGTKLTDNMVGCNFYSGGALYPYGVCWDRTAKPKEITVDLGKPEKFSALRLHLSSYPSMDMLRGEWQIGVEGLVSSDGKTFRSMGTFNTRPLWKDLPVNFMMPDNESLRAGCLELILPKAAEGQYVQFRITPAAKHNVICTEVQVFDQIKREPYDLRIVLPHEQVGAASQ